MPKRKQGEVDNEGVQDFELIELLIRERETAPSTSTQQGNDFESFKARFQSYIDQIPSYLHSVGKEGFFPHFFLGSFSTLIDTEIAKKLDIEKIYFRFDGSKTLKVTVTKKGEIKSSQDAIDKVNLFVIADSGSKNKEFSHGELEEILSQMNAPGKTQYVSNAKSELEVKLVEISKNADNEMTVEIKNTKLDKNDKRLQFTEIKKGKWNKPENDIAKLTNSDKKEVEKSLDKVLKKVSKIHSEYKGSLIYADKAREAAHHGFMAGALVNFRYRHNLRVYLEQLAGRGYADIILVPRGKDRSLNAIPIIIELKAATKEELKELEKGGKIKDGSQTTPAVALKQAEDYTKGFQPNVMRVLTTANDILCVGVNLDYPSAISDIATKSRDQEITPLFNNILESIDKQNNGEITQKQLKTQIQENIERIYHTFPGTGEKGDSHYFSRFLSGQSILLDKALEVQFKKYIFIPNVVTYAKFCNLLLDACDQISKPEISKIVRNLVKEVESVDLGLVDLEIVDIVRKIKEENGKNVETIKNIIKKDIIEKDGVKEKIKEVLKNENIPTEALRPSKQPPRTTAPKKEIDPDPSYAVVTMVFIPEEDSKKLTYVMNIVEADGRAEVVSKGIPLDKLKQEIGNRKIVELNLNFNIKKQKSDFKEYFSMEVGEPISLEQYSNKKTDKFKGNFENVPYPDELKRTFDEALGSQRPSTPGQTLSIDKYNELLKAIGKGTFPLKPLIEKEAHFQAVLHGAFSYYSDIKLGESQENRALVLTEFQTGRGKRIDMVVHGIKFADQASSATEYDPVGLELKGPREGKTADALKDEANKQIADEYTKGVTYKTLTDGKEVDFIGVVFDKGASNADSLILMSKDEFASVKVIHSSIFSISQQQTKKKFNLNRCVKQSSRSKRSVGPCLFSKDDVEKFSKGKVDENNVDKVIIDSEKFLTYVKSSQDEGKNAQLVEFIGNKNIEGDYKYLVDKVIGDQGYERYIQNERIKDLQSDVLQQNSGLTKNPKLKSRLMNAAGGIQLIRGIHGAIVSCKDGTATDCGLNLGGIGWSFASQPIENVMVKIAPKVVTSSEKVVARIVPGTLGRQTKFAVKLAGVKFGSTIAKGVAGAVAGVFDIIDIGISANNLVDCKNRESSDNPCGEKEIRDNIASISFSGVSFVSGVALTAAGMPVVGIAVGFGLMVGYGVYSGVSNIVEYEKKYDTTHGENWSIFWRTILFQDMASDVQHLADRKNTVDSLAKEVWKALNNAPNSVVAYGVGLGKLDGHILRPDYAKIFMDKEDSNTGDLSRVIPDSIPGASRICLPKVTQKDYEKGITSSVQPPLYYCDNAMVISHVSRVKTKQKGSTIVYDLRNINKGEIVGSNKWNNNFLIYPGTTKITGGNNVVNRFVLVNNPSFLGKMIGGTNSINILDLSQLAVNKVTGVIGYHFKPNAYGKLQVRINNRLLIDDYVSNNLFNYHYIGRQNKVDEVLCMGDSEHFTESDNRDVIIDSGGGLDRDRKDVVENCRKVIISPYTTVKGGKSNYTFYVKTAEYKGRGLYSEIDVDGTGTVVFPEFDLLSDCDQITYSKNSNTLSLRINFGQNNQFTLDIRNYVEQSSNKPHFVLIDKNGSNIVPKIERSDSSTIKISSFELHSEYSLGNFDDVETHYKKILNDDKDDKVLSVIRDKTQSQDNSVVPHMVFGSSGDDVINFDQGTMFARGGKGRDMYVIADSIGNKEVKIDNHSDDEKADTLFMPEVEKDFSIQQCDLHLKHNNSNIRVKNYLQDPNYRHLIVMNNKGEAFIPYVQSMSCSSSEKGKLVPFLQATQTQNMFLLPKDFQGDHIVIDSHLKDIEKYKDKDDLLLIREGEVPFIIRIEGFYNDQSKWRDVNFLLWNNGNFSQYLGLQQEVNGIIDYQDKLKGDYRKIVKEYNVDFTQSISITHNQDDTLTSLGNDEERIGVVILKNIAPNQIEVSSSGTDLIFRDKRSNHTVNIKGWNNSKSYRISTLEFDLGLEPITIRRLDKFSLHEVGKIQSLIDIASENYQNKSKYTPKVENDFKCLISVEGFERENKEPTYQCLGFSSLQDQVSFTENFCSLEQLTEFRDKSNSTQVSALSKNLQNNLSLNGYDQNIADKCSKLMLAEENNQQSKISSMIKDIEESTFLGQSENKLDLGRCLSERKKRSSHFCPAFLENIYNELNREEIERRNIVLEESSMRVITSDHKTLDIEDLPIREVVINDNINRKRSLRSTLDLRKLVQQINEDLGIKPISMVIKDASDLLIKVSISATDLQQDVMTIRLKDALINKWYKKLQIIFNNAPMEIDNSLDLKPSLFISDKRIIVVTPQEVEEKNKLVISKKAGQYAFLYSGYDLIVTNAFNANMELCIIYFKDFYKEPKMKTLSIRFTDKEILLSDEIDKIYNSESADKLNYVSSILNLQESSLPLEVSSSSDIEAQGKFKRTPLHFASEAGEWDKVRLLLDRGANPEVQDKFGYTPIFLATQSGKWSVVELLLNYGANINAQDEEDRTLLCFAVSGNNLDMVQFLLDRGVSIEAQDKFGYTPILYAARSGKWSVVKLFIDNGAKFNNETTFQGTPLHFAIQEGNLDMVQFLLDKGTDIEVQNAYDQKPLHLAVKAGRLDILKLLLDREPNINATDMDGQTPSDLAIQKGYNNIVEILRQAQLNLDKELLIAVRSGDFDKVQDHIIRGADVNAIDIIAGRKPIHITAKRNYKDIVDLLLSKGVSVDQADKSNGMTPLHYAASKGSLEVVKFLIEKGAGVNIKDRYGGTPLHVAAEQGELEVIKYLIEKGAIVNAKDKDGRTPLDIARDKGYNNIVNYLEEELNKEREKPVQRKRRHHHGGHNSHHLSRKPRAIDSSNQPKIATSSGAKPSSWINDLFGWIRSSVSGLLSSKPESTPSPISQVDARVDVNGMIMLLDLLIRRVTGQKYISTVDQSISPLEAKGYALSITKGFEKVVEQTAKDSKVSVHRLNIDFVGIQKEVTGKIMSGKFNEISGILKSYVEKACPGKEAGKLSSKKFDKFIAQFNKGLLNQSIEQALHNGDGTLEVDGVKKQQMSLEPQSYLSNASIQSHSKVSTCLSDVGVTKLGGNINR
ncbi:ankyrin repeat domain-containing protein [Wolbachia endosymbiont of Laodelphax striatellus]|uniref:ankyrin repeat domain-containing protein n=1 Tax=Wolbachia endosymbiont of Laodelphax striatellus TaxID=368602 RepID=UPI00117DEA1C|nr:ankyrin repeat domain-containing protein [Wolbachia endosymbiont of Laodelphax striatellus]